MASRYFIRFRIAALLLLAACTPGTPTVPEAEWSLTTLALQAADIVTDSSAADGINDQMAAVVTTVDPVLIDPLIAAHQREKAAITGTAVEQTPRCSSEPPTARRANAPHPPRARPAAQ